MRFSYLIAKNQHILDFSFIAANSPLFHISNFLALTIEAIYRNIRDMAQKRVPTMTPDALGDDNRVALTEKYRVKRLVVKRMERPPRSIPAMMISAA